MLDLVSKEIRTFFRLPDDFQITRETTAANVNGWDSLAHASLIMELEQAAGVEVPLDEITEFQNVGDLVDCLERLKSS